MIIALIAASWASEVPDDAYERGYALGQQAAEEIRPRRAALRSFGAGVGVAAVSTTLVGPCLAAPCIASGALVPGVIAISQGAPDVDAPDDAFRYELGYKHGFTDHAARRRVAPSVVGGVVGALVGTTGAYLGVGLAYQRLGYDVTSFPFNTGD